MTAWNTVIEVANDAIQKLAVLINTDPLHGVQHQQHMALALLCKQEAMTAKAWGLDPAKYKQSIDRAIWLVRVGGLPSDLT